MIGRFSSLQHLSTGALTALRRFPATLLMACVVFILACRIVMKGAVDSDFQVGVMLPFMIAIPLSFAITVAWEARAIKAASALVMSLVSAASLALFFWTFYTTSSTVFFSRFAQFNLAAHLLVAFLPFWRDGHSAGFWHYNQNLFGRFLTSAFYSAVICAGLCLSLLTFDYLLNVKVPTQSYTYIFFATAFLFNTWHFVAGVRPVDPNSNMVLAYPNSVKIFTQFVLIPLCTLYLGILYIYLIKIIVQQDLPRGNIGYLVTSVSILGIFSLLMLAPVNDKKENIWIRWFSNGFYIALVPLLVLLFIGTWKRIEAYDLTEKRYFLLVIGAWLFTMAAYFLASKKKSIIVIPVSLFFLAVLSGMGPWSAYHLSLVRQKEHLRELLTAVGAFDGGRVKKITKEPSFDHRKDISSTLDYLNSTHGADVLQPWFSTDFKPKNADRRWSETRYSYDTTHKMAEEIGITYLNTWETEETAKNNVNLEYDEKARLIDLRGYDFLYPYSNYAVNVDPSSVTSFRMAGHDYTVSIEAKSMDLHVKEGLVEKVTLPLRPFFELVKTGKKITWDQRQLTADGVGLSVKLILTEFNGDSPHEGPRLNSLTGQLLLRRKN